MKQLKTGVTFKSAAFNNTESKDYFINPYCFGDDVLKWMIEQLRNNGVEVRNEPLQEDWGWLLTFSCENSEYNFNFGWRPGDIGKEDDGDWLGWIEQECGCWQSLFGGGKHNVSPCAIDAINAVLSNSEKIYDIHWCEEKELR